MRIGAMVLGIVGGLIAFAIGIIGFMLGDLGSFVGAKGSGFLKIVSLVVPVIGLVGAGMVKGKPAIGSSLMLVSGLAIIGFMGLNFASLLPAVPLFIGGCLGLMDVKEVSQSN